MTSDHTPGLLLIVGSVVFLVGAAVGVPRVFTEPGPQARLRLLTDHRGMWHAAQPLYGLGPITAAAGVGWLGWLTLGADLIFLAGYLWLNDIPPFVFYLLLLLAGLATR